MTREQAVESLSWLKARLSIGLGDMDKLSPHYKDMVDEVQSIAVAIAALRGPQPDPITGLVPCGCGEWIYTIEKGSCMDYHVTAKCSECGWDWFSKDGVGNCSAVFGAFITNGDSKRDEAERFLIENAKANNKLNYCPNCGAKMEDKPCE